MRIRIEQVITGQCRRRKARETFFRPPGASASDEETVSRRLLRR
jgi:hypothetical protein